MASFCGFQPGDALRLSGMVRFVVFDARSCHHVRAAAVEAIEPNMAGPTGLVSCIFLRSTIMPLPSMQVARQDCPVLPERPCVSFAAFDSIWDGG